MECLIGAGKEMGLEGKELQDFVREQQSHRGASEGVGNKGALVRSRRGRQSAKFGRQNAKFKGQRRKPREGMS